MSYFGLKRIKNDGIWGLSGFLDPPPLPKLKRIEYVRLGSVSPPYGGGGIQKSFLRKILVFESM